MRQPNHRALEAEAIVAQMAPASSDAMVVALTLLLGGAPCPVADVEYARDLWEEKEHRAALDAFLLARVALPQIAEVLEISIDTVAAYAHLYMDVTVFRNKLERRSYAMRYGDDKYASELVRTAVVAGAEYLLWTFDEKHDTLEPATVVRRAMVDGYFRGLAHRGNGITTDVTREAHRWMQFGVSNAQSLEKLDPRTARSAHEELSIAIKGRELTISVGAGPVAPEDVLK